jgi:uncharacterized protein
VDPGPLRDALTAVAGVATGVLSGAFGVGGAVISTPAIRLLGCSAALAVGTTLPSIIPGAVTGVNRYRTTDLIRWKVAVPACAGAPAAVVGAWLSDVLPGGGKPLMLATAALLLWSAWSLIRGGSSPEPDVAPDRPIAPIAAAIGIAAGTISGLLGIGGGVLMVPAFRKLLGLPIKSAVATSLVCVAVFAVPGTLTQALLDNIDWRYALWLTVGVVPGAMAGSSLAIKTSDQRLRRMFGVFLVVVAFAFAGGELLDSGGG